MPNKLLFLIGLLSLQVATATKAATVSTGDLGLNVITAAGAYEWSPTVSSLTNDLPATLTVAYGLWNDPSVTVHASVNGTEVGSFLVDNPFFSGVATATFTFTNLLVDGVNTIRLDGLGVSEGEYVISSIDLTYNIPLPPPVVTNPPASGPSISKVLHYLNRPALTPAVAGVSGSVRLQLNEQGNSSLQKVDLNTSGLQPDTDYVLIVVLGEDPNTNSVGTVTSDSQGRVRISLMKGTGEGGETLPAGLDPVTDIRGLGLGTVEGATIAWSVINTSSKFQYLVERTLGQQDTNATPSGSITLEANASSVNFNLTATGLSANSTYYLALNGNVLMTATAYDDGTLELTTWPAGAPAVLDLRTLALLDSSNNVVLSTTLPK